MIRTEHHSLNKSVPVPILQDPDKFFFAIIPKFLKLSNRNDFGWFDMKDDK
jgi:hypothetical protein